MRINSNIASLTAQRSLSFINRALSRSLERLSSGKRINSAKDDASGLAVSIGLKSQANGLTRTVQNINEAFGYLNAADGALQTQVDLVHRMRELAVQAANGTLSSNDRSQIQLELNELMEEFNRIAENTLFNGSRLLDGSFEEASLQVGTQKDQNISIGIESSTEAEVFSEEVLTGDGTFSSDLSILDPNNTWREIADLNGDGLNEMITYNASVVFVYANDGEGSFSLSKTLAQTASNFEVHDFNGDGNDDLFFWDSNTRTVILSDGDGGFLSPTTTSLNAAQTVHHEAIDFNSDGYLDLLSSNNLYNTVTVNFGIGSGGFSSATTVSSGVTFNGSIFTEDLNNDGYEDIFFGYTVSQTRYVRMGSASGTFSTGTTMTTITTTDSGTDNVADMNGDGILDFVDKDTLGNLEVRFGTSSGNYSALSETAMGLNFTNIFVNDIDGDGDNDVVAGYSVGGTAAVQVNSGNGSLSAGTAINFGSANTYIQSLQDFNGDGKADIIARGTTNLLQRLGTSAATFTSTATLSWTNLVDTSVIDINQDGYLDLVGTIGTPEVRVVQGNATGLGPIQYYSKTSSSGAFVWNLEVADLNDDGFDDLMFWDNDVYSGETLTLMQDTTTTVEAAQFDLETQNSAQDALEILDNALENLNERRSHIGALQNRLEVAANSNSLTRENLLSAHSNTIDADLAHETAELIRTQIAQQAATAVLATANTSLQMALRLLNY